MRAPRVHRCSHHAAIAAVAGFCYFPFFLRLFCLLFVYPLLPADTKALFRRSHAAVVRVIL